MSLADQHFALVTSKRLIFGTSAALFPVSFYLERFAIFGYGVIAVTLMCFIAFIPNWRQRTDPGLRFASREVVDAFYAEVAELQKKRAP